MPFSSANIYISNILLRKPAVLFIFFRDLRYWWAYFCVKPLSNIKFTSLDLAELCRNFYQSRQIREKLNMPPSFTFERYVEKRRWPNFEIELTDIISSADSSPCLYTNQTTTKIKLKNCSFLTFHRIKIYSFWCDVSRDRRLQLQREKKQTRNRQFLWNCSSAMKFRNTYLLLIWSKGQKTPDNIQDLLSSRKWSLQGVSNNLSRVQAVNVTWDIWIICIVQF